MQSKTQKTRHVTARPRHAKPIGVSITRTPDVGNHLRQRQPDERESLLAAVEQWPSLIPDQASTSARQRNGSLLVATSTADTPLKDPPQVNNVLSAPGERLDPHTRHLMEQRFGADFGRVRVHHGASAAQSARLMAANAFTVGQSIVFGEGRYAPHSAMGQRLLAHELAHTIQQRGIQRSPIGSLLSNEDPALEAEADLAATAITSGTGLPSLRRAHRSVVQRQSSPTSTYNIQLTYPPNHTERHERLILPDALRVLRRFADRISANLEGSYEGHRYLHEIHEDQYIVAGISDLFGGRSIPSLMIWNIPRVRLQQARMMIAEGNVARATTLLQQAANETRERERRVYEYREGTIAGAERAIFALEVVEVAGAVAATVATGGTAGVFVGAGYAGVQRLAGEATSVAIGLQDRIDWAGVAFDTLFALAAGKFGGQLGNKIAARLGGRVAARVASSLIVGRASGIAHAVAREVFDAARGRTELTVDGFLDRIASQLSARAIFLDLVAHGVGEVGARARATPPTEPTRTPPPRPRLIQGGDPGPVPIRDGRVVSPARRGGGGGPVARARGSALPAVEPQPVREPIIEPVREVPLPATQPTRATNTPPGPGQPPNPAAQGVAIAAVVSSAQQQQPPPPRNMPTGLTPTLVDAIPLVWFKHLSYYPDPIFLGGHPYDMTVQTHLPLGEEIGVFHEHLPSVNKIVQLVPEVRNPNRVRQFRTTLANYGFNWAPYEADHVQDLQWSGFDRVDNFWPMEAIPNGLAGPRQNQNQQVTYYPQYRSPAPMTVSIQQGRNSINPNDNLNLRFFRVSTVRRL